MKHIAIVGGGYLGVELAKHLETCAKVSLVEERTHFVHSTALIRAVAEPSILDRALIPYDNLLKHGQLLTARASKVDEKGVTLWDGTRVDADYVVVATGSDNAMPFKAKGADIEGLRKASGEIHAKLKRARTVAIVGAGAVGSELAGEIKHFMPDKDVVLISNEQSLFPQQPAKLGQMLLKRLTSAGVEVVLGTRAENLEKLTEPYAGTLKLSSGREIAADLIFPAIGSRAVSTLLEDLPGAEKTTANRFKVDAWMRPSEHPNVFAAGDVADCGDAMTIVAISRQLPWLKKTFEELINGKSLEELKPYTPWDEKAALLVPLGPKKGASFLGLFTTGDFLTRLIKGKDLFLTKYNKALGRV